MTSRFDGQAPSFPTPLCRPTRALGTSPPPSPLHVTRDPRVSIRSAGSRESLTSRPASTSSVNTLITGLTVHVGIQRESGKPYEFQQSLPSHSQALRHLRVALPMPLQQPVEGPSAVARVGTVQIRVTPSRKRASSKGESRHPRKDSRRARPRRSESPCNALFHGKRHRLLHPRASPLRRLASWHGGRQEVDGVTVRRSAPHSLTIYLGET